MKRWDVVITQSSEVDLNHIHTYIADVLHEPAIALKQVSRIRKAIFSLCEMPERYPVYVRDFRRMNVGNYAVFYQVRPQAELVSVIAVIYGARDIDSVLEEKFD
ncbi:MAG: type II toxin-antitoxin system RelE/ParE family toxin [Firmicutes bacterium]|nr:type II toxin-antitoxin system RelE/ParE family toxin [Bacillota bacterium]